jgi:translocation and assembly module TamB
MTRGRVLLAGVALVGLASGAVWFQRHQLAQGALDRVFANRGVLARYTVRDIGLRWQRIEKLSIGDPGAPDLTADWADVRMTAGWNGVRVTAIRAGGVRLKARFDGKQLRLGALDRLMPTPVAGKPLVLPDLELDVRDARVRFDTPYGPIGARIDGVGNLVNGFRGKLAAIAPATGTGDCRAARATAYLDVSIRNRRPNVAGPVRAAGVRCDGVEIAASSVALKATLDVALTQVHGTAAFESGGVRRGGIVLAGLTGHVQFQGPFANLRGTLQAAAANARAGDIRATGLAIDARFAGLAGAGRVTAQRILPGTALAQRVTQAARSAVATPAGPVLAQLAEAVKNASEGVVLDADAAYANGSLTIPHARARARGGGVLTLSGGSGIRLGRQGLSADTQISLRGGGFPGIASTFLRQPDGTTRGLARVEPMTSAGARVALAPLRFAARPSGIMLIETQATLSGPVGSGTIQGLRFPVSALIEPTGRVDFNRGCSPIVFERLAIGGLTLSPAGFRLCPDSGSLLAIGPRGISGGGSVADFRLAGRFGTSALSMVAGTARLSLADSRFALRDVALRLGDGEGMSRLDVASAEGASSKGGLAGRFAGVSGAIGRAPLLISDASGPWTFRDGTLALTGNITVTDADASPRFQPLLGEQVSLRMAGGRIDVTGTLMHPETRNEVMRVTIVHDLGAGSGTAVLDVPGLRFSKALQPEALTRLTLGVIANVEGGVSGRGNIAWNARGVSSTGRFRTDGALNLAAAFGPVEGLRGEIVFDDLLALATPPGQQVFIDSINPGIPVLAGTITYRLLPGQKLAVQGGQWPFAGGDLILEPTAIDMGAPVERRLTFRVTALDAAKFIQQLEFENLAATGLFDGTMPMIFDSTGGRIEGGRLVARAEGGTIAYVGEVSNADMPVFGKIAFDALKSIRYRNLTIALDGPLDGEIVSLVSFNGVNQSPVGPPKGIFARQLVGLPFRFNIAIRAPFRGLLSTARTFTDPSLLIRRAEPLPAELPGQQPVQPPASETKR